MQTEGVRTKDRILICSTEAKSAIRSQPMVLVATYQPAVQQRKGFYGNDLSGATGKLFTISKSNEIMCVLSHVFKKS